MTDDNLIYPNGPAANQFPNMTVDKNGTYGLQVEKMLAV